MIFPAWLLSIFIIGGVVFAFALGFLAWAYFFRKKKAYLFLLYSRDCQRRRVIKADLKTDPNNKSNKMFFFSGTDTTLPLKEATCFQEGKSYREIMQNRDGTYSYIKGARIDEIDYLSLSLTPDEKALALHRIKENEVRYQNPMGKTQAAMLITGFILIILLTIGIVYSTIAYVGAGKNVVKVVQENQAFLKQFEQTTSVLSEISEQQASITAVLIAGKGNITRRIS